MDIGEQVASVTWARELKRLGVPLDTVWKWVQSGKGKKKKWEPMLEVPEGTTAGRILPAFTVAELGELLNGHREAFVKLYKGAMPRYSYDSATGKMQWVATAMGAEGASTVSLAVKNEANARASLLASVLVLEASRR